MISEINTFFFYAQEQRFSPQKPVSWLTMVLLGGAEAAGHSLLPVHSAAPRLFTQL